MSARIEIERIRGEGKVPDRLKIGDLILDSSDVSVSGDEPWGVEISGWKDAEEFCALRVCDIRALIGSVFLPLKADWNSQLDGIEVVLQAANGTPVEELEFSCGTDMSQWANPYSLSIYVDSLRSAVEAHGVEAIDLSCDDTDGILDSFFWWNFRCRIRNSDAVIKAEIHYWLNHLREIEKTARQLATMNSQKESLVTFFEFPPSLKTTCQQYLMYFVQFLADLGIKADSELKEQAGQVLFSVTPQNPSTALNSIAEALRIYLGLPRNPGFSITASQFSDLAVSQLKSNVLFLQSQLELAKATIQAKDAAIQALDLTLLSSGGS